MYSIGEKVILVKGTDRLTESVGKPVTVTNNCLMGFVEISDGTHKAVVPESFVKKAE